MKEEINKIPAVALRGMTILPSMIVHFDISRERSVKAVEEAMQRDQRLFVVAQRSADTKEPAKEDLYRVGTIVTVKQVMKLPKNIFRVLVEGTDRAELICLEDAEGFLEADISVFSEEEEGMLDTRSQEAMARTLKSIFKDYCEENGKMSFLRRFWR